MTGRLSGRFSTICPPRPLTIPKLAHAELRSLPCCSDVPRAVSFELPAWHAASFPRHPPSRRRPPLPCALVLPRRARVSGGSGAPHWLARHCTPLQASSRHHLPPRPAARTVAQPRLARHVPRAPGVDRRAAVPPTTCAARGAVCLHVLRRRRVDGSAALPWPAALELVGRRLREASGRSRGSQDGHPRRR